MNFDNLVELTKLAGGYIFVTPYYINLVGVRNPGEVNKFNDILYYYWFDNQGKLNMNKVTKFTTDPGLKILRAPINSKGAAILKEGWYRKLWKIGKHKNSYTALVQYSPCTVFRDKNLDGNLDFNPNTVDTGMFGINLHRANERNTSIQVDGWSAGCQVMADPEDFKKFMQCIMKANSVGQCYFSYLLVRNSALLK